MGQPETDRSDAPITFLDAPATCARIGLSRATLYRLVESGDFPKPVRLSSGRRAWVEAEVTAWMRQKIEERDRG